MKKEKYIKILEFLLGIMFACSASCLSNFLIIQYTPKVLIAITIIVSFLCALFFWKKTINKHIENIKNNKISSIICLILSIVISYKLNHNMLISAFVIFIIYTYMYERY